MKKQPPQADEFLTTTQVAAELGIGIGRVQVYLREGRLIGAKRFGRQWMVPRSALATLKVGPSHRPKKND